MLTGGRNWTGESGFFFLVPRDQNFGSIVGAMLKPFERSPHNFCLCFQHLPNIHLTSLNTCLNRLNRPFELSMQTSSEITINAYIDQCIVSIKTLNPNGLCNELS